ITRTLVPRAGAASRVVALRGRTGDLDASLERRLVSLKAGRGTTQSRPPRVGASGAREGCLTPALRTLARRSTVSVELDAQPLPDLPDEIEVFAYDVVREALGNAVRHARATVVRVRLERHEDRLELVVGDDGVGGAVLSRRSRL